MSGKILFFSGNFLLPSGINRTTICIEIFAISKMELQRILSCTAGGAGIVSNTRREALENGRVL